MTLIVLTGQLSSNPTQPMISLQQLPPYNSQFLIFPRGGYCREATLNRALRGSKGYFSIDFLKISIEIKVEG